MRPYLSEERVSNRLLSVSVAAMLIVSGCNVGPKYHPPAVQAPAAYKEVTPENQKDIENWKTAQPSDDAVLRGKWWESFNDPELNTLEDQVNVSNQSIASAEASFMAARAMVREARSQLFPTVTTDPSITREKQSANLKAFSTSTSGTGGSTPTATASKAFTDYSFPFDATWVPDLWGKIRNTVNASAYGAQASAADLANTRLSMQAEVAVDYFQLRSQDSLKQLLDTTVQAYQESLRLTKVLYQTGIDNDEPVAQAETQLEQTEAQDTNVGILRSQYEHAIAMLVGQPASTFSIPVESLKVNPPPIPIGVPSQLLERRPDVAADERLMAQANAQIGVARAAYFPTLTLSASGGFESTAASTWFSWPSVLWAIGASASETIFDAGLRRATVQQYRSMYDETIANYRQTVLTAFQQVEDNLSSLRILSKEIQEQQVAIDSAQRFLTDANNRWKLGLDPYLDVITAETTLLSNQQTMVNLRMQQITASVQLVEALGGGWDKTQLPSTARLVTNAP
ncbi:MAG TPA: efflux transporter outer membrane subunit [Candidatus Acidoferrales bacterium]|jgi:NodT family efflux transporter outer membrane factor (OMF) lipoprotein|nr:efflux transporter outer membrane subunit [Candidatus Acidoferrales bacterium]